MLDSDLFKTLNKTECALRPRKLDSDWLKNQVRAFLLKTFSVLFVSQGKDDMTNHMVLSLLPADFEVNSWQYSSLGLGSI